MNYSKYRFNLDMQSYISQISLPVRQHDTGIVLRINLTDGGVPYVINDGCRAVFYARKSDGNPLMNDCVIEKNTTICYELTQQTTSCSGVVDCEVRLYGKDGNLITTPRFILVIDSRVVHDEDFPLSESEQTVLDNIILSEQKRLQSEVEREENYEKLITEMRESHETMLDTVETASNVATTLREKLDTGDYDGITPHVGDNGNWWFDDEDSGVLARGVTPHIGTNGNWWIDEVDTGVLANGLVIPLRPGTGENSVVQQSDKPNTASGKGASSFGGNSKADAEYAFVVNYGGRALGKKSTVEGDGCLTGESATAGHAQGKGTKEMAPAGHTEGQETEITWQGTAGHAQNHKTKVTAKYASAAGNNTIASARSQFVVGEFNKENPNALFQVGNGTSDSNRSNALEVLKDGTLLGPGVPKVVTGTATPVIDSSLNAGFITIVFDFTPKFVFARNSRGAASLIWANGHQVQVTGNLQNKSSLINNTLTLYVGAYDDEDWDYTAIGIGEASGASDEGATPLVTFTYYNTRYTVAEGTTWAAFVADVGNPESPNYDGSWYVAENGYVGDSGGLAVVDRQGNHVKGIDVIRAENYESVGYTPEEIQVTITFTIDGNSYEVDNGTTWREWCDTTLIENEIEDYYEWVVDGDYINNFVTWQPVVDENGSYVNPDDKIVAGAYELE